MGYTHYIKTPNWNNRDEKGWEKALPIVKKILKKYKDILQYELDDKRKPVANKKMIRFNGIGEDGHETFLVKNNAVQTDSGYTDPSFCFCKTARKPYDIAVCEVLLVLKAYCPHIEIGSDGFYGSLAEQTDGVTMDGTWDQAMQNVKEYGLDFHAEIVGTHGGRDGQPDPYCSFEIIFDGTQGPTLVK
jgi:hypothetical protein